MLADKTIKLLGVGALYIQGIVHTQRGDYISQFKTRANDAGNWYTLNSSVPIVKTMNISTVAKYSL